jgi:predicted RND superfamily exporter protein
MLHFRRLKPALLALLPLGISALWVIPGMALFDMQFNIVNLMILPLFMGMAADNGIHLVDRALETPGTAWSPFATSVGKAVVLSSLTTIAGFGSLMVAQHAGIFSFGLVLALAVSSNLLAVLLVLPLALRVFPVSPTSTTPVPPSSVPAQPNRPSMP